jgi:hypothetical protein
MKVLDKFPGRPRRAKKVRTPDTISLEELQQGCLAFQQRERRDAMYKTATFLVNHFWGKPTEVAEGLGVLLCVWNNAFYRLGSFDYDLLEQCIAKNQAVLDAFRHRNILTHSPDDDRKIRPLFQEFLDALQICEGKCKGRASPVGVAKALHLLAPGFFPLWDEKIAQDILDAAGGSLPVKCIGSIHCNGGLMHLLDVHRKAGRLPANPADEVATVWDIKGDLWTYRFAAS